MLLSHVVIRIFCYAIHTFRSFRSREPAQKAILVQQGLDGLDSDSSIRRSMVPVNESRMFVRCAHGWMLVALFLVSPGFVMPMLPTIQTTTKSAMAQGAVPSGASFVPDLQRRQLMNVVLVTTAAIPLFVALGAYLWYFVPPVATGAGGAQLCGDLDGMPISYTSWVKKHKANDRELVQGLKGEPYYIISTEESIKDLCLAISVHPPGLCCSLGQGQEQVLLPMSWISIRWEWQGCSWPCSIVLGTGTHYDLGRQFGIVPMDGAGFPNRNRSVVEVSNVSKPKLLLLCAGDRWSSLFDAFRKQFWWPGRPWKLSG